MGRVTSRYRVVRVVDGVATARPDSLAAEEPLEIRVSGRPLTVTMRTPGNDFDLARGFLVSEGVVATDSDVAAIRYCAEIGPPGQDRDDETARHTLGR